MRKELVWKERNKTVTGKPLDGLEKSKFLKIEEFLRENQKFVETERGLKESKYSGGRCSVPYVTFNNKKETFIVTVREVIMICEVEKYKKEFRKNI